MLNLSSYHSNGLPVVVWSNKVNLIGEKVYKPKIHFCEHCHKPILIYGRLIPCKHVFCFSCALLCLTNNHLNPTNTATTAIVNNRQQQQQQHSPPPLSSHHNSTSLPNEYRKHNNHYHQSNRIFTDNNTHSDESNSNTTNHNDINMTCSPSLTSINNHIYHHQNNLNLLTTNPTGNNHLDTGCHRCGGKALRVERNTLNSIFVCQIDSCKRTYLSAKDLQAHITHRHSKNKSNNAIASSASMVAISSSPYISSSTLHHLNSHNQARSSVSNNGTNTSNNNQDHQHNRQSSSSNSNANNCNTSNSNNSNNYSNNYGLPNNNHHQSRRDKESNHNHHHLSNGSANSKDRERDRDRCRDRESYQRERQRQRESKEYHRQSLQRAALWAEASVQMLEGGLTR